MTIHSPKYARLHAFSRPDRIAQPVDWRSGKRFGCRHRVRWFTGRCIRLFTGCLLLAMTAASMTGCASEKGDRCQGQTIERWRSGNFSGGTWEVRATCADDQACMVFDVESHNFQNHAFCVTSPDPDPACDGMTGRMCADAAHLFTCIEGFRIAPGLSGAQAEACPAARPTCFEAETGLAFCVADAAPAVVCSGHASRSMDVCAVDYAACRRSSFAQFCSDASTSVTCLDDVVISSQRCDNLDGGGTCVETESVETHPCVY